VGLRQKDRAKAVETVGAGNDSRKFSGQRTMASTENVVIKGRIISTQSGKKLRSFPRFGVAAERNR